MARVVQALLITNYLFVLLVRYLIGLAPLSPLPL